MDDEIPGTDELEAIGFKFGSDGEYMYLYPMGPNGLEVVVAIESNRRADNYCMATALSLHWSYSMGVSGKISPSFSICDNPTLAQIKAIVDCLKGEFKFLTEFRQLTEAYNRAKSS